MQKQGLVVRHSKTKEAKAENREYTQLQLTLIDMKLTNKHPHRNTIALVISPPH